MGKSLDGKKLPAGISQRKNGSYIGRVMYNGETHTLYNRSLTQLKNDMNDLRYSLAHGTFVPSSRITFGDFYDEWLTTYKADTVKESTLKNYSRYKKHFKSIERVRLADVRASHIQKILTGMSREGKSQGTINDIYMTVHNVFKFAVKLGLVQNNPCSQVIIPKSKKDPKKGIALTKEEQEIFLEYCDGCYLGDMFKLDLVTGMRGGELSALRWCDIDFKNKMIHVNHTLTNENRLTSPKTKSSLRTIPMTNKAVEILKNRREEYIEANGNIVPINEDAFVFNVLGAPITVTRREKGFKSVVNKIVEEGEDFPPGFTMHGLRHTFATRCGEAGMDMNTLKTILGHSSLSMTADLYSHVQDDQKRDQMDKIQAAL